MVIFFKIRTSWLVSHQWYWHVRIDKFCLLKVTWLEHKIFEKRTPFAKNTATAVALRKESNNPLSQTRRSRRP